MNARLSQLLTQGCRDRLCIQPISSSSLVMGPPNYLSACFFGAWAEKVPIYDFALWASVCSSSGCSPQFLLSRYNVNLPSHGISHNAALSSVAFVTFG